MQSAEYGNIGLFPYEPRENQREIIETIRSTVERGGHLVMESGTGSGKTVCTLSAVLESIKEDRRRLLYLTRTNSQQSQVIREARTIDPSLPVVAMQGRRNMCPMIGRSAEFQNGTPEELARICSDMKKSGECPHFKKMKGMKEEEIAALFLQKGPLTAEQLRAEAVSIGICPYESAKMLMRGAKVVTAPYIFFFNPHIRRAMLDWMGAAVSDIVLVVDEAHNLPDYARELESAELSLRSLEMCRKEVREFGDPEIMDGFSLSDLISMMERVITDLAGEYLRQDDSLIPPGAVMEFLMTETGKTSAALQKAFLNAEDFGILIREKKREEKKLPRSYVHSLGVFLQFWYMLDAEEYVKLISGEGGNIRLEAYCMDPRLATAVCNDCQSSIHMSGTLRPLDEYRTSVGLPEDTVLAAFPSPFPEGNLKILAVEDVTTGYDDWQRDPEMPERIARHITGITEAGRRNTGVFFPSYSIMSRVLAEMPDDAGIVRDEKGMGQKELQRRLDDFRRGEGGARILTTVMGGRVSEGIDFPASEMEIAIIVGIPYPKPTAKQEALMRYYDIKFGKGWEYTVKAPAIRKILQAIGRIIRRETDRGVAVILDKRAGALKEAIEFVWTENPGEEVREFFEC